MLQLAAAATLAGFTQLLGDCPEPSQSVELSAKDK